MKKPILKKYEKEDRTCVYNVQLFNLENKLLGIYHERYMQPRPMVERRTAKSDVSVSNPRARFLLLEQKPFLYHEWSGMVETELCALKNKTSGEGAGAL